MAVRKTVAGTFEVDIRDQYGKKRLKTFKTHREAKAYEKETLALISKAEYTPPSSKTVGEVAREWYEQKASQNYRRSSLVGWKNRVDNYIVESLGSIRLRDLDVKMVENALAEWSKQVSAVSANMALTTLAAVLDMAERRGDVSRNVVDKAERLKVATEDDGDEVDEDKVYTKAELLRLIQACQGMIRALVMLLAFTGLRIGEALALSWDAVDLKAARLDVRLTLGDSGEAASPLFQPPKTKSSKRSIPLPHELVKELTAWKIRSPISERHLVFAMEDGRPYQRYRVIELLDEAISKAGIKRLTPHGLRHTFASLLLAAGKPVTEVSHLLGHKNAHITMTTYAHFIREESTATQELAASVLNVSSNVSN
jgi:integrase